MLEWIGTTLLLTTLSIMLARVLVNRRGSSRGIADSVLYFVSTALPLSLVSRSVFKTTTRVPPQLDALSAAVVDAMRWAQDANNIAALRRYNAISDARRLRVVRARGAAVMGSNALLAMFHVRDSTDTHKSLNAHGGVLPTQAPCGIWLAQHTNHLDTVSGPNVVVLLYIHGGGFCCGSPTSSFDSLFDIICNFNRKEFKKRLVVFSLEYPLAPESQYTAQLDAATSAYWHLVRDLNISNVLVGGDSAGAHIAINLLNRLAKEHPRASKPIASILFSPCVDPGMTFTPDTPHPIPHFDTISTEGARFRSMNAFGNLDGLPFLATDAKDNLPQRPSFDSAQLRQQLKMRDLYRLSSDDLHLAERGTLVVFGGAEIMAPAIEHFSSTIKKKESVDGPSASFLQVAKVDGMPHNFHLIPLTSLKKSGDSARDLVVSFIQKCLA
ncbi:hypothetical protein HDU81_006113 [Chytriomyces hyalinus]|nr:hypothetical protein HDU81_006113 [Chytriomyces hyalinus]